MRISEWSSDVCSSDLRRLFRDEPHRAAARELRGDGRRHVARLRGPCLAHVPLRPADRARGAPLGPGRLIKRTTQGVSTCWANFDRVIICFRRHCLEAPPVYRRRSEEHTSELQSLMRISYAVFCLKKKKHTEVKY